MRKSLRTFSAVICRATARPMINLYRIIGFWRHKSMYEPKGKSVRKVFSDI